MAQIQDNTHKTKPRSTCFLGCLGFSGEKFSEKKSPDMVKSHNRKKPRWFSWSRFRMKKSATKTVPVDTTTTVPEKVKEIHAMKSDKKIAQKHHNIPATGVTSTQIPATLPHQRVHETSHETGQSTILESRKSLDSVKDDTGQRRLSFGRNTEVRRTVVCQPHHHPAGSPENMSKSGRTATLLSPSAPFPPPPPKRKKQGANAGGNYHVSVETDTAAAGKFDPIVGMSIIMVTLIIMLLWGRLCAVLCTSAWFYFIPRFKNPVESNSNTTVKNGSKNSGDSYVNSDEYKKKVVLEGFLERNHRNGFGIL
uniref:Uncharacterized protein n=1 Tax=Davidia involucrata TaxID=16924 RepID=A0A5B7BYZ1_DAVIN